MLSYLSSCLPLHCVLNTHTHTHTHTYTYTYTYTYMHACIHTYIHITHTHTLICPHMLALTLCLEDIHTHTHTPNIYIRRWRAGGGGGGGGFIDCEVMLAMCLSIFEICVLRYVFGHASYDMSFDMRPTICLWTCVLTPALIVIFQNHNP